MEQAADTIDAALPCALEWFGNAAKMRVIARIVSEGRPLTIFDYGAGDGAAWPETLRRNPGIRLVAYEPDPDSAAKFRHRLPQATLFSGAASEIDVEADIAVSFSVFEHVADRRAYLAHAARCVRSGGTFFLNYDDGHFRHPTSRLDALRNRIAPALPSLGLVKYYQATVAKDDADRMIASAGFSIADERYENLEALKSLAKTIDHETRKDFAAMWLRVEDDLNLRFRRTTDRTFQGDTTNLWREMGSRTLELVRLP